MLEVVLRFVQKKEDFERSQLDIAKSLLSYLNNNDNEIHVEFDHTPIKGETIWFRFNNFRSVRLNVLKVTPNSTVCFDSKSECSTCIGGIIVEVNIPELNTGEYCIGG